MSEVIAKLTKTLIKQQPASTNDEEQSTTTIHYDPNKRRGSKSLPTSPLLSKKFQKQKNKYFTEPFIGTDKSKSWILASLLGHRGMSQSVDYIGENETTKSMEKIIEKSTSSVQIDNSDNSTNNNNSNYNKGHSRQPKPTELREMNFWSPTSL